MYCTTEKPRPTDFTVTLQGSSDSAFEQSNITMTFPCIPHSFARLPCAIAKQPSSSPCTIIVNRNMYGKASSLLEALRGNCPAYVLSMESYECRVLLCEISFQLKYRREFFAHVGVREEDVYVAQSDKYSDYPYEKTYKVFSEWVRETRVPPKTMKQLVSLLHSCETEFHEGSWHVAYDTTNLKVCDVDLFKILSEHITDVWKFIARLLGMKGREIQEVIANSDPQFLREFAFQMLCKWKCCLGDYATSSKLFNAIQCINEHTGLCSEPLSSLVC